jgi:hypothetical protein
MANRAKLTALLSAVLVGFFVLIGGATAASAHAGHDHGPTPTVSTPEIVVPSINAVVDTGTEAEDGSTRAGDLAELADGPTKAPQPLHQGNCCCGSIACHAAVAALLIELTPGYFYSVRLKPRPVAALAGTKEGGIERPPRRVIAL